MGAAAQCAAPACGAGGGRRRARAGLILALAAALACAGGERPAAPVAKPGSGPLDPTAGQIAALPDTEVVSDGGVVRVTWPSDLLFDDGHTDLRPDGAERMRAFAARVASYPDPVLRVKAHTDVDGSESYSLDLSESRAERVRALLIDAGLPPARIGAAGFGGEFPVASNDTDDGRARNRRLEIEISPSATSFAAPAAPDLR